VITVSRRVRPIIQLLLGSESRSLDLSPRGDDGATKFGFGMIVNLAADIDGITRVLDADAISRLTGPDDRSSRSSRRPWRAHELFAHEPIPQTGHGPWNRRRLAAETGVRALDEALEPGDPCPVCQRDLDDHAVYRLGFFDAFVRNAAATAAAYAERAELEATIGGVALGALVAAGITVLLGGFAPKVRPSPPDPTSLSTPRTSWRAEERGIPLSI
jgi:hypothetical protein